MKLYIDSIMGLMRVKRYQVANLIGTSERTLSKMETNLFEVKENKVYRLIRLWEVAQYLASLLIYDEIYGCLLNGEIAFPEELDEDGEILKLSLIGYICAYPREPEKSWRHRADEATRDYEEFMKTGK